MWAFLALAAMTPVGLVVGRLVDRPFARIATNLVFAWIGLAVTLFFLLVASEVVRGTVEGVSQLLDRPSSDSRRVLLSRAIAGTVSILGFGLAGTGIWSALGKIAIRRVRVPLARFPEALAGYRIVQLTDLHIGPTLRKLWLERVVAQVNALEGDAVVITGDLVDGSVRELREEVAPIAMLRARHGVFFVTGNHEYYSGVDEWLVEITRLGVRVLRNERVALGDEAGSFDLAGVDDFSARRFGGGHGADLARALAGREPSRALVLLAHQPKQIFESAARGVDLQLSGHTHGGQIFPWGLFVRLDQPYVAGLARHGETQIYVSRGTGVWGPPMRIAAPSEIAVIELFPG
jgi:predicted MPP superfamily phosphohydrolase